MFVLGNQWSPTTLFTTVRRCTMFGLRLQPQALMPHQVGFEPAIVLRSLFKGWDMSLVVSNMRAVHLIICQIAQNRDSN
jgi:hypothetical protein